MKPLKNVNVMQYMSESKSLSKRTTHGMQCNSVCADCSCAVLRTFYHVREMQETYCMQMCDCRSMRGAGYAWRKRLFVHPRNGASWQPRTSQLYNEGWRKRGWEI